MEITLKEKVIQLNTLQPFGVEITNLPSSELSLLDGKTLATLVKKYHLVLIRDITNINKEQLVDYAKSVGPLLEWEFGQVMEMRAATEPKNYLFTNGSVPFHWDGAFHQVPRYLLFHCIEAPIAQGGGETLFANTQSIWQSATTKEQSLWQSINITYATEKLAHYGGVVTAKLVQQHIDTANTILRFAEPVPETMLNPVTVTVETYSAEKNEIFLQDIAMRCYDKRNCYTHTWQENDLLIADNHALIHGRHAFHTFSPRHLRRIQIL